MEYDKQSKVLLSLGIFSHLFYLAIAAFLSISYTSVLIFFMSNTVFLIYVQQQQIHRELKKRDNTQKSE